MKRLLAFLLNSICLLTWGQNKISNYVSNGSFEKKIDCNNFPIVNKATGWTAPGSDTSQTGSLLFSISCYSNVPITGSGYQWPVNGESFCKIQSYCTNMCFYPYIRVYPRNRLKATLINGQTYCVKMQVSLTNTSPRAINKLGFYFGDCSLDTIKYPCLPLTYLNPQIESNTIYADTLNWSTLSGTFTANGTEKYLVIGNFKSDAQTNTSLTLPNSAEDWAEYFIDAVSCIPVNLPAYAGPDKRCIVGDSVYLGRESDFAIDPYCQWYQLPNTTNTIAVSSGLWVKPVVTTTYAVRQELECGSVFWDTVVVYRDEVGITEVKNQTEFFISPNPAAEFIVVSSATGFNHSTFIIRDVAGRLVKTIQLTDAQFKTKINLELENGIYFCTLLDVGNNRGSRRLIIQN